MLIELSTEFSKTLTINGIKTDSYFSLVDDTSDHKRKILYTICGQTKILESDFKNSTVDIPNNCPVRFFKHAVSVKDDQWRDKVCEFWNEPNKNTL